MALDPKTLDRIRKLLAQATSDNENEAATASAMAERLMKQHGLTLRDLLGENPDIYESQIENLKFLQIWCWGLFTACAWANDSHVVRVEEEVEGKRKVTAHILGKENGVKRALYMFGYFEAELDKGARQAMESNQISGSIDLNSWRTGAVISLQSRILRRNKQPFRPSAAMEIRALTITTSARQKAEQHAKQAWKKTYTPGMANLVTRPLAKERGRAYGSAIEMPSKDARQISPTENKSEKAAPS